MDAIPELLKAVSPDRMKRDLFHLSKDPLPYRRANYFRPGQSVSSLDEADQFILAALREAGYDPTKEEVLIQSFRFAVEKPFPHRFATPEPNDPWHAAYNLYADKTGESKPDEYIYILAHKDSQSWFDSPGANDNAVGTTALLEMARALANYATARTIRFLFCNEEHIPWTSVTAARNARARNEEIVAIFNMDSMTGRSPEDRDAGRMTHYSVFTAPEGERLADAMIEANARYEIGLDQRKAKREHPGDDDGSFIKEGYGAAVINLGSWPYAEPNYHNVGDTPETIDIEHLTRIVKTTLAAILLLDTR